MIPKTNVVSAMLILGLSASMSVAGNPSGLTRQDCRQIFPGTNSSEAVRTLGSGVQWTEAWERGSWGPAEEFRGYILLKSLQHEGKTITVLLGVTNTDVISSAKIKGNGGAEEEFLSQFHGKSVRQNFALARTPEDLLSVPAKIRMMQGNLSLSESLVQAVNDIALAAVNVMK
ncbi:hypothetical protein FBQ85_07845 [Cytophagia bacterium CHB2]|nr:hypothetical protein [Cytophagia bacterium CHB2]